MTEITITGKLGNIYSFKGDYNLRKGDKVYTTPQRTWVGLTDEELREIIYETGFGLLMNVWFYEHEGNPRKVLQAIEAKLKEKNA